MSWFGGSSKERDSSPKDFTSSDEAYHSSSSSNLMDRSTGGGGGGGGALAELQQFQVMVQQSLMVQEIIGDLTEMAFVKCITGKPNDHLSGKEVACTHSVVGKWMDTNTFMNGRLAKKQQSASSEY
jgi:Tim10/DDP family zinc finger